MYHIPNKDLESSNNISRNAQANKQTEYVTLPKTDYIEVASEQVHLEENKGIIQTIGEYISKLFK